MNTDQLLLIDLSAIAHQIWHVSGNEPDPSHVSHQIIARVRALASAHLHAAICCDAGKSFRADIDPTYKANRDTENRAPLRHQMDVACETLAKDGFPVWRVQGMEADDLIATATAKAVAMDGDVLIASSDKDLLQLVTDRVTTKSLTTGNTIDADGVVVKFGVRPDQMLDYLSLVGDVSDNVKGAKGIGGVIAAKLLKEFGTIEAIYEAMSKGVVKSLTPSLRSSMVEFQDRWPMVRSLIALRSDAEIPFAEIAVERTAAPMEVEDMDDTHPESEYPAEQSMAAFAEQEQRDIAATKRAEERAKASEPKDVVVEKPSADMLKALGVTERQGRTETTLPVPYAPPVDFRQQLEPRSLEDAKTIANIAFASKALGAYGTPQAILLTILRGRELGMGAMASLHGFHHIDGKPTMSAATIQSLVLKSKLAAYFRCSERTPERCTFVTKRGDDPEFALTYTLDEAKAAWSKDESSWKKSGWGKHPADMLVARASSKLARLVYPDVVSGLYAPEEME